MARPFATTQLPWFLGGGTKTEYGSEETITGTVTWTDANKLGSIDSSLGAVKAS